MYCEAIGHSVKATIGLWSHIQNPIFANRKNNAYAFAGVLKVSTTQIISQLEDNLRGIYTSTMEYLALNRKAQFIVAIRAVTVDCESASAE